MAITVGKLFNNSTALYNMKLLAGEKGLGNLVDWVHIVEDAEVTEFLHGGELVFTAGYMNRQPGWMLNFAKNLYAAEVSAIVVNLGPYTHVVEDEVMEYCNQVGFPIFTIPWKTRMVDMTRDYCTRIMHNQQIEDSIATTMKNIIFQTGDRNQNISNMERHGFPQDVHLCFVVISMISVKKSRHNQNMELLKKRVEQVAKMRQNMFLSFSYDSDLVVVLVEKALDPVEKFVDRLFVEVERYREMFELTIGVSQIRQGFLEQEDNFECGVQAGKMAKRRNEKVVYYDRLDLFKVLLNVKNKQVLQKYYEEVMGPLEQYDMKNGTDLLSFLAVYIESNGSPQLVAQQEYVHRNTVNNQIKKIEKIIGANLSNLDDKVRCSIALTIKEILQ